MSENHRKNIMRESDLVIFLCNFVNAYYMFDTILSNLHKQSYLILEIILLS